MFANLAPITTTYPSFTGATLLTALAMCATVAIGLRLLLGHDTPATAPAPDDTRTMCGACRMGRHPEHIHRLESSVHRCGCACAEPDRAAVHHPGRLS